jgi:hypothetical protein
MSIVVFALSVAAVFAILMVLVSAYMRRVADVALTVPFRAAETIVNGRIPDRWVQRINRRIARASRLPLLRRDVSGTELLLVELDKLARFCEKSPFYETAQARELLLAELRDTRERWASMTWEELLSEHNGGSRLDTLEGM